MRRVSAIHPGVRFPWRANSGWGQPAGMAAYPYPTLTGRELYNAPSISRLNILPVVTMKNYILHGAKLTGEVPYAPGFPSLTVEELADARLLDGTMLWLEGELQSNIVYVSRRQIIQRFYDVKLPAPAASVNRPSRADVTRLYTRGPKDAEGDEAAIPEGEWRICDYVGDDVKDGAEIEDSERLVIEGDKEKGLVLLAGGLGPLAEAQGTYWYIEELCQTMRDEMAGPAASFWITGIPMNETESRQRAEDKNTKVKFLPGDFTLTHYGNNPLLQHLVELYKVALSRYYSTMTMTDISDQPGRPVAEDLFLRMGPMLRAVNYHRLKIKEACALWGASVSFTEIHSDTAADRNTAYMMIEAIRAAGYLTPEEAKQKVLELL